MIRVFVWGPAFLHSAVVPCTVEKFADASAFERIVRVGFQSYECFVVERWWGQGFALEGAFIQGCGRGLAYQYFL